MTDRYANHAAGITGPVISSIAITPSDATDLSEVTRALHANTSGNVAVIMAGDTASVTKTVLSGVTYPWRVKRVLATGTTASVIAEY